MKLLQTKQAKNAFGIGILCSFSYLAVYFARNILSAVTPQMLEQTGYSTESIGSVSSAYFICYAFGQLINGAIGDKIKAKYMISFGMILAAACNFLFPLLPASSVPSLAVYAMTGFFLSMIYGPMTKVTADNTEPLYRTRCSLGYTFASFLGSPLAGAASTVFVWDSVFRLGSGVLLMMGLLAFTIFICFEKRGIVRYPKYAPKEKSGSGIRILFRRGIVKFTLISILTGVIRTTVVFWIPTYITQYLGFSPQQSATAFTVATFLISFAAFIGVFLYERLGYDMNRTLMIGFLSGAVCFFLMFLIKQPLVNITLLILGVMSNNVSATMLWSVYCPGLQDTGLVSGATGFLDFVSYIAASVSGVLFSGMASDFGWRPLIFSWFLLMAAGIAVSVLFREKSGKNVDSSACL